MNKSKKMKRTRKRGGGKLFGTKSKLDPNNFVTLNTPCNLCGQNKYEMRDGTIGKAKSTGLFGGTNTATAITSFFCLNCGNAIIIRNIKKKQKQKNAEAFFPNIIVPQQLFPAVAAM